MSNNCLLGSFGGFEPHVLHACEVQEQVCKSHSAVQVLQVCASLHILLKLDPGCKDA